MAVLAVRSAVLTDFAAVFPLLPTVFIVFLPAEEADCFMVFVMDFSAVFTVFDPV